MGANFFIDNASTVEAEVRPAHGERARLNLTFRPVDKSAIGFSVTMRDRQAVLDLADTIRDAAERLAPIELDYRAAEAAVAGLVPFARRAFETEAGAL
jgi:hypothetical protein